MCEAAGISHSQFLGGPARWTALDREKALAYAVWRRENCPGCGTRKEHWDPAQGGHRFAFIPDSYRCPGCELLEQEREQIPDGTKGIHVFLSPNPDLIGDPS